MQNLKTHFGLTEQNARFIWLQETEIRILKWKFCMKSLTFSCLLCALNLHFAQTLQILTIAKTVATNAWSGSKVAEHNRDRLPVISYLCLFSIFMLQIFTWLKTKTIKKKVNRN